VNYFGGENNLENYKVVGIIREVGGKV
jgi:hypothetical protein